MCKFQFLHIFMCDSNMNYCVNKTHPKPTRTEFVDVHWDNCVIFPIILLHHFECRVKSCFLTFDQFCLLYINSQSEVFLKDSTLLTGLRIC